MMKLVLAALLASASGSKASGVPPIVSPGQARPAKQPRRSRVHRIARYFRRKDGEVAELRLQGIGYGEIVKILVIAEMSRRPIAELLAKNREGYGWGTISRRLGLDIEAVKKRADRARRDLGIHVLAPAGPAAAPAVKAGKE